MRATSEDPVWDDRRNDSSGAAIFSDAPCLAVDPHAQRTRRWRFASEVGSLGLAQSGRLIVALRHGVGLFDPDTYAWMHLADIEAERGPATRLNDGKVGPDGAFWVGSMDNSSGAVRQPIASLYRCESEWPCRSEDRQHPGFQRARVLARWTGSFSIPTRAVFGWIRWHLTPGGAISNRTRIAELDEEIGRPDGAAVDVEGYYWSAGVSAGRLNRFAPDGALASSVRLPLKAPTMPCFGGPRLEDLYLTSLVGQADRSACGNGDGCKKQCGWFARQSIPRRLSPWASRGRVAPAVLRASKPVRDVSNRLAWKIGQGGCRVGRRCQICSNTSINIINRALLGGATLSEIARRYGLALGSLHRHRSKCLGLPTSQAVTAAPSRLAGIEAALPTREEVAGGFASIRSQLDGDR